MVWDGGGERGGEGIGVGGVGGGGGRVWVKEIVDYG